MKSFMLTRRFSLLLVIIANQLGSGCFQAPFHSSGSVKSVVTTKLTSVSIEKEGREVARFDPTLNVPQKIEASSASLSGTALTIEPGALTVPTDIVIEQAASLKETGVLKDLGLQADVKVEKEGAPVIIRPTENAVLLKPMTLEIPAPALGLRGKFFGLEDSQFDNLVVMYRTWKSDNSGMVSGLIPRSELKVENGVVKFGTMNFGAFQSVVLDVKIETAKEQPTVEPIRNVNNVSVIDTKGVVSEVNIAYAESKPILVWGKPLISVDSVNRTVSLTATFSGDLKVSGCQMTLRNDPNASPSYFLDTASELSGTIKIPTKTKQNFYGGFYCTDNYGRSTISPLSDSVTMPEEAASTLAITNPPVYVYSGDSYTFKVTGGYPPYQYSLPAGSLSSVSADGVFKGSADAGTTSVMLTVSDNQHQTVTALFTVFQPVSIPNVPSTVYTGDTFPVSGNGGAPPYQFSIKSGGGSLANNIYSAPATAGTVILVATDANGRSGEKIFSVGVRPLSVNFSPAAIMTMGTSNVTIVSGVPPYTYTLAGPDSYNAGTYDDKAGIYTAGYMAGIVTLTVTDSTGAQASGTINIIGSISFYPSTTNVKINGSLLLDGVYGGLAPYTFSIVSGMGSLTSDNMGQWHYLASGMPGTAIVQVNDLSGQSMQVSLNIRGTGSMDPSYGPPYNGGYNPFSMPYGYGESSINRMKFDNQNNILIGGWGNYCCTYPDTDQMGVLKMLGNGISTDSTFGSYGSASFSYGPNGQVRTSSLFVAPDGSSYLIGTAEPTAGNRDFFIVSFNSSGVLNTAFGGGSGFLAIDFGGNENGIDLKMQMVSNVPYFIAIGVNEADSHILFARFDATGVLDSNFGIGGKKDSGFIGSVEDMMVEADGSILIAGQSNTGQFCIAKADATGSPDINFGTNGTFIESSSGGRAYRLLRQSDGNTLVVGARSNGVSYEWLAIRYTPAWSLDASFATGGYFSADLGPLDDAARAVAVLPNGQIVLGGGYSENDASGFVYPRIMRLMANGQIDTAFGIGGLADMSTMYGYGWISDLLIQNNADGYRILGLFDEKGTGNGRLVGIIP